MSLPALSQQYYAKGNVPFPDTSSARAIIQSQMWLLKQFLINGTVTGGTVGSHARAAHSIWTVLGSSDGTTAAMDTVDRWTTYANLIFDSNGNAHSWIALRNSFLGYDLVLDCNQTNNVNARIAATRVADATFSSGSLTSGPTSSSEFIAGANGSTGPGNSGSFLGDSTTGGTDYADFVCPDDGHFSFFAIRAGQGIVHSALKFFDTANAPVSDNRNHFLSVNISSSGRGTWQASSLYGTSAFAGRSINNVAVNVGGYNSAGVFGNSSVPGQYGQDGGTSDFLAWAVHAYTLTGTTSYRGQVRDTYWVAMAPIGGSYPSAAAQTHVVVGDIMEPWPDVNPLT